MNRRDVHSAQQAELVSMRSSGIVVAVHASQLIPACSDSIDTAVLASDQNGESVICMVEEGAGAKDTAEGTSPHLGVYAKPAEVVVTGAMNVEELHDLAHPSLGFAGLAEFVNANWDRATMKFSPEMTMLLETFSRL